MVTPSDGEGSKTLPARHLSPATPLGQAFASQLV